MSKKTIGIVLLIVGVLIILVGLSAGYIGLSDTTVIGPNKMLMAGVGAIVTIVGVVLMLQKKIGDMSLVGPRPHVQLEVDYYTSEQCRRLSVPPGLTGLWQVEGKADCTFNELIQLDLEYIERWSLLLDFSIITRTVLLMMRGGEGFWSRMAKKLPTQRKNGRGYLSEAVHEPQVILESEKTES